MATGEVAVGEVSFGGCASWWIDSKNLILGRTNFSTVVSGINLISATITDRVL